MSFDNSRVTFDPWKDYFGVVMQQGRVQLDSDWNEWQAELARRLQAGTLDVLGLAGVPSTTPAGFKIDWDTTQTPNILTIGPGRIYVDGILVENHGAWANAQWDPALAEWSGSPQTQGVAPKSINYNQQPWLPGAICPTPASPTAQGKYLVYLDVWQRDVTCLDDPNLLEKAVGTDTTGRYQTVWLVNYVDVSNVTSVSCSTLGSSIDKWTKAVQPSPSRLTTGIVGTSAKKPGPCSLSPAPGYSGMENQLYRVEIHQAGIASSSPPASSTPSTVATFKFSRDNATVTTAADVINSTQLTVQSLGKDQVLGFHSGDWVEITGTIRELTGTPGELHRIQNVNPATNTITLSTPVSSDFLPAPQSAPSPGIRITRWDQSGKVYQGDGTTVWWDLDADGATGDIPVPPANTTLLLENGITVTFGLADSGGLFRMGDFWNFTARTADASVETLSGAPPSGIHHHYCRLAIADFSQSPPKISDCRQIFPSLANPSIHVKQVLLGSTPLLNDGTIQVQDLLNLQPSSTPPTPPLGISIVCDQPLDPKIITQPNQLNCPVCYVTVDVPASVPVLVPVGSGVSTGWEAAGPGFNPLTLAAVVNVGPSDTINWIPVKSSLLALQSFPPGGPPLLARLTLKGSGIWAAGNPAVRLNGADQRMGGLQPPSYDGRPYADFQIWFWLVCQPAVILTPSNHDFGDVSEGQPATSPPIKVTNYGSSPITFKIAPGAFTLAIPETTPTISPCSSESVPAATASGPSVCWISVTFAPATAGPFTGQVIVSGASDGSTPGIALKGNSVTPPQMQVSDYGTGLQFSSDLVVGYTDNSVPPVTLTSIGTTPLTLSGISLDDLVNFQLTSSPFVPASGGNVGLDQGEPCEITVAFKPQSAGTFNPNLTIYHNALNKANPLVIQVSGTSIPRPAFVPGVQGTTVTTAITYIAQSNLTPGFTDPAPPESAYPIAVVVGQFPSPGTPVQIGSTVTLTCQIPVPDVESVEISAALLAITQAGLVPIIGIRPSPPPKFKGSTVVAGGGETPPKGTKLPAGSQVKLDFVLDADE